MGARITSAEIAPEESIARVARPGAGAVLTFRGTVRADRDGREVKGIEYHAYEEMALREMEKIVEEIGRLWPGIALDIVHRIGYLEAGETSVLIAVASPHRREGFEGLRHAIDRIKESVPIWKKEFYADGYAWIEGF